MRFADIADFDGIFASLARSRGEKRGFFCTLYAREQCVIRLVLVNENDFFYRLCIFVHFVVSERFHSVLLKYFCDFSVDFSLVDKHRSFRLRNDCVRIVDGIVFYIAAAKIEKPRKIVKGRNECHVATLTFRVFAKMSKFAFNALARRSVVKIIRFAARNFGSVLPYLVNDFFIVNEFHAGANVFEIFHEIDRRRLKIERNHGRLRQIRNEFCKLGAIGLAHFHKFRFAFFELGFRLNEISSVRPQIRVVFGDDKRACASRKSAQKRTSFEVIHNVLAAVVVACEHDVCVNALLFNVFLQFFDVFFHFLTTCTV